jgi:undecaprenyl-diphosphatase
MDADPTPPPTTVPVRRRRLPIPLLAAVAFLAGFGWLLLEVTRGGGVTRFDHELAVRLHEVAVSSPGLTAFFKGVTELGSRRFLIGLAVVVAVVLIAARLWRLALLWGAVQILGALLVGELKERVDRPRPEWADPVVTETARSFPSGHATGSTIAYGLSAYLIGLRWRSRGARAAAIVGLGALVLLIGFSRLYLGVHYFSDVLAGYCLGLIALCLSVGIIEWVRRREPKVDQPEP